MSSATGNGSYVDDLQSRDERAVSAMLAPGLGGPLSLLSAIGRLPMTDDSWKALQDLYDAISPEMNANLRSEPASGAPTLPGFSPDDVLRFNYDEGHAGRLTVFETEGGSIDFERVFERPDAWEFIHKYLAYGEPDSGENVVFCTGLNTVHQKVEGEKTAPERLIHYTKVLGFGKLSQIHTGTSMDQGDVRVDLSKAVMFRSLLAVAERRLEDAGVAPSYEEKRVAVWSSRQIDRLQLVLSTSNRVDTPLKKDLRLIFDTTKDPAGDPVVIMAYSRGSLELVAALNKHVKDSKHAGESSSAIEQRLFERVTVVTIGNASKDFPDGPAYIHLSCWNDPLSKERGVNGKSKKGAGEKAVFLNCDSPFHPDAFDNHNFGAVTAQYLSVVMRLNNTMRYRELFDIAHSEKGLFIPDDIKAVHFAMIQLTKGYQWLWNPSAAWKDIPIGALPEPSDAEGLLRHRFGNEVVERMLQTF